MEKDASEILEQELKEAAKSHEMTKENLKKAEIIGFRNLPDKIIKTDKFGFIIDR
jgi:hypothetical protein